MSQTSPQPPGNPLTETLRGLFGPLLDLIKSWPPLLSFGGVTMFLVVILSLLGAVVPDNLVPLLYLAFGLTEVAFVWLLWDERQRAAKTPAPKLTAQPEKRLEDNMQKDKSTPPPAAPDQRDQTVHGAQTNIEQSQGPVLSGVFNAPVTVGATPQPSPQAPGAAPPDADSDKLDRLHQVLRARFDREELRTLCFRLGVGYDDLRGEGHSARARELVLYMSRRTGGLERLRAAIEVARPGALG